MQQLLSLAANTLFYQFGVPIETPAGLMTALVSVDRDETRLRHKSGFQGVEMSTVNASLQVAAVDGALLSIGDTVSLASDELTGSFDIVHKEPVSGGLIRLVLTEHQDGNNQVEDIWR